MEKSISQSQNIVFFGGAGVSTESGIPDFRSTDGLYHQKFAYPPETILSHSFFHAHTEYFYNFYREKMLILDVEPNRAHLALARLEKVPLEALIGQCFRGIFRNVNNKWLSTYERAALYGETLETMDYSPEIDTYLKVICFPTFRGHCGVILFDINGIRLTRNSPDADRALAMYLFGKT